MYKLLLSILFLSTLSFAMSVDDIVKKVDQRDDGDHIISQMTMILIDKQKNQRIRSLKRFTKDFGKDIHQSIYFLSPNDIKNTAFLTFDYDDNKKDDDQWLYLPALKKTKRIASTDKSGSFMGSDFSYSDMTKPNIKDYTYSIKKSKKIKGHDAWIIERIPKNKKVTEETGYKKSYIYVRKDNFVVIGAIHYLTDGKKKYMSVKKLKEIEGIWFTTEIVMKTTKNKQLLHSTILQLSQIKLNQNLDDDIFTIRQIEKGI
jgi:hypothetical protein